MVGSKSSHKVCQVTKLAKPPFFGPQKVVEALRLRPAREERSDKVGGYPQQGGGREVSVGKVRRRKVD